MKNRGEILNDKSGQITIFIIIAVAIIAATVLIYFVFPQVLVSFGVGTSNPNEFMKTCMEKDLQNAIESVSLQGGSANPENFVLYNGDKIEYLCYTGEYYKPCIMQQPLLKEHIENEIKRSIDGASKNCLDSLKSSFQKQGYDVNLQSGEVVVELLPKIVSVTFDTPLTLTKGNPQRFDKLSISINNNLYELASIATSILNWEAKYGDAETTIYMNYYHDLKVEKKLQTDGTTIYILTNRDSGSRFQFATRSVVIPPGYKFDEALIK